MGHLEDAARFDLHDKPVQAIAAYRQAIVRGEADLAAYVDYAVLLFECHDYGYASHHWLPTDFFETALGRGLEILDLAELLFGSQPEILFWRYYFKRIYLGGPEFYEEAEQQANRGTSVPYFYLSAEPNGDRFADDTQRLRNAVQAGRTAKERYIRSVLESRSNGLPDA